MRDHVDMLEAGEVFLEALELAPGARDAFLSDRCAGDSALRTEVESLLSSHDSQGLVPEMAEERPFGGRFPDRVAEYRTVRVLGEGGMGVVLLAIREGQGFEQTVALKLLRGSFADPLLVQRLEEERRLLARLEHPGIARLIDGGLTADGHPYYAMEYVQGEEILAYCDNRCASIRDRLGLFADICDAVHHAHQQLVVHRDLKPTNILVTQEGRPKLLDFGIAKNLETVASAEQTAGWITPAYASPEQVTGGPVSTRSDVYSLGVLLCELVAGSRPYDAAVNAPAELGRVIAEVPPEKPSELALRGLRARDGEITPRATPEEVAARRRATPSRLARLLRGDIDRIVLKALAKEPERRYDSASTLAQDIRRHLEGRPIHARPDGSAYRIGKFVRRHRSLTAALVLLVIAVVAGAGGIAWQASRVVAQRDRAEEEASRARVVTALMTDIFRLGDPTQARGDTIGVRQVLEEGVLRVDATLGDDPTLQASLFLELGRIYRNLGILDEAERLGDRAAKLRAQLESDSLAYADALGFYGMVLRDRGRSEEAVRQLERAISIREEVLSAPDTTLAALLVGLGWEVRAQGDHERAGALFTRALELQRALLGEGHPDLATSLLGLASSSHELGNFDEAEELFLAALDRGATERPDPVSATALVSVGMVRRLQERYREAEPLLQSALTMRLALFGSEHPDVIEAREQLGVELAALGRFREAEALLSENLEIAMRVLGEEHQRTRGSREALASVDRELGRYDLALARMDSVVAAKIRAHGGDHPGTVFSLNLMGDVHLLAGRPHQAAVRFREALAMGARLGSNEGTYGALSRHGLAQVALATGDVGAADSLNAWALSHARADLRADHRYVLDMMRTQSRILLIRGSQREAGAVLDTVLEAERRKHPRPHPRIGATLALLGEAREAQGDATGAADARRRALEEFGALPESHPARRALRLLVAEPSGPSAAPR
jgi:serine/threonine-protein kinase